MRSVLNPRLAVYKVSERIGIDLEAPCNLSKASPLFVETLNLPKSLMQALSSLVLG
jgi:hypothetical protein